MSVIAEQTAEAPVATPPTPLTVVAAPVAVEVPVAEPVAPAPVGISDTIAEFNNLVEAQIEGETAAAITEDVVEIDEEAPAEEAATEETAPEADAAEPEFKLGADVPIEEFTEAEAAYLDTVEITPELQAILDRKTAELAAKSEALTVFEALPAKEIVVEISNAVQRIYESSVNEKGMIELDGQPLLDVFKTTMPDAVPAIALAFVQSDSAKYPGVSMLGEYMIDHFGYEKADKMIAFGQTDMPLPVLPPSSQLPQGIDEKSKEAYWRLPEVKRFQIQDLVDDIVESQGELEDASDYRKADIEAELSKKMALLNAEYDAIDNIQKNINADRDNAERTQRQQFENQQQFRNQVNTSYNTEILGLADTFAADLAPRLTYADADTQLSQARNIMSRVNNALAFQIDGNGAVSADPMADHYAKQLASEGVKFDFAKGRNLLHAHYKATEKLEALKQQRASQPHIDNATRERNKIMFDIKTEQKVLLGQISSKYVKSSGNALSKQVDAIAQKKQAVRSVTNGKPHTSMKNADVMKDIAAFNRQVAAATGEELFESYRQ